ncbi:hypothetical protein MMPV_003452 [Pyropia vietnamensis]
MDRSSPRSAPRSAATVASLPPPSARPLTGFLTRLAATEGGATDGSPQSRPTNSGATRKATPPPDIVALLRAVHTAAAVTAGGPSAGSLRTLFTAVLAVLRRLVAAVATAARPAAAATAAVTSAVAVSVGDRARRGGAWSVTLGRVGVTLVVAPSGGEGVRPGSGEAGCKVRLVEGEVDPQAWLGKLGGGARRSRLSASKRGISPVHSLA